MKKDRPAKCDNCGGRSNISCVTCNRNICGDCYHCGEAGNVCGLCRDRELGRKRYDSLCLTGKPMPSFEDWYDANA